MGDLCQMGDFCRMWVHCWVCMAVFFGMVNMLDGPILVMLRDNGLES